MAGNFQYCEKFAAPSDKWTSKALKWAERFPVFCFLDHNNYPGYPYHTLNCTIAVNAAAEFSTNNTHLAFEALKTFTDTHKNSWLFGFLTYDLKNAIESLSSENFDGVGMPLLHFFKPEIFIEINGNEVKISSEDLPPASIFEDILLQDDSVTQAENTPNIIPRIPKRQYIDIVKKLKGHITNGDVYEINFCQEFYAENCEIDPVNTFLKLNRLSGAPFSCFYKWYDKFLICSSPERFLKKEKNRLISQPIKGTVRRGNSEKEDLYLRQLLETSLKDQAENVMIVDLVRNDLAKSSAPGSIQVEALFKVYSFRQVHQMISTIISETLPDIHPVDIIRNTFPMGSMTGAPKVMAMELIEKYEQTKRGLFSGSVGYFSPDRDFDFNVVIRSILYDQSGRYLSLQTGGAITYDSDPEQEYEECLVKAKAMMKAVSDGDTTATVLEKGAAHVYR